MLSVRPLVPGDDDVVRDIFWSTIQLGTHLVDVARLDRYEQLCLGWYLGCEREHARVLEDDGRPVGYVLVGTRAAAHRRWVRRRATSFALASTAALVARRYDPTTRCFLRHRLVDGWALRRTPTPMPVHAHLNLLRPARLGPGARMLAEHVDDVCRRVGAVGWFGDVNAPVGRRAAAIERLGLEVVHRSPNRTLSVAACAPVERLTVVRWLPEQVAAA